MAEEEDRREHKQPAIVVVVLLRKVGEAHGLDPGADHGMAVQSDGPVGKGRSKQALKNAPQSMSR